MVPVITLIRSMFPICIVCRVQEKLKYCDSIKQKPVFACIQTVRINENK